MSRLARTPYSTNASSPTACAVPAGVGLPADDARARRRRRDRCSPTERDDERPSDWRRTGSASTSYLRRERRSARRCPRVVPLTGDASDRRTSGSFRPTDRRSCSRCTRAPIEFATLPFVNVADLLAQMPLPVPGDPRPLGCARHPRAGGSRRRHAAGAPRRGDRRPSTPRSTARPSRSSSCCSGAARAARPNRLRAVSHRVRRREADVGARLLREAFRRGLPRRDAVAGASARRSRGVGGDRRASSPPSRACSAIATITAAT